MVQQQPQQVTYLYPVQQTQIAQPVLGQPVMAVAPSVTYVVGPAPPSHVAPHCIPTRHMQPFEMKCYSCGETGETEVKSEYSAMQWLICLLIVLLGGWIFCLCFIPFCCCKSMRRYEHFCQKCGTAVAFREASK